MSEPIASIIVPRWVRVLAFLRVPFAVRRMRAKRYLDWFILKNQDEIVRRSQDRMTEMVMYGSTDIGDECGACGEKPARRFISASGAWCQSCWEKRPRFYGKGVAEMLGIKKES